MFLVVGCADNRLPGSLFSAGAIVDAGQTITSKLGGAEGGEMRVYWELAKLGFRRASAYRAAAVSGAITNTFFDFPNPCGRTTVPRTI